MTAIIGIGMIIISLIMFILAGNIKADDDFFGTVVIFLSLILFAAGFLTIHLRKPTAMDVYRGNTALQITYKNNVPVDSTVVYK